MRLQGSAVFLLLVEDEAPLAESLCAVLKAKGHRVDWAADGRIALRQLQLERYDAVILDLGLPHLDGSGVLQVLRADTAQSNYGHTQGIPVLVLSARDNSHDKVCALDAGADDYLSKPFDPDELEAVCLRCYADGWAGLARRSHGQGFAMSKPNGFFSAMNTPLALAHASTQPCFLWCKRKASLCHVRRCLTVYLPKMKTSASTP